MTEPEFQAPPRRRLSSWLVTGVALVAILAVAAYFSFAGMDWDEGQHLHPDERFLTMVESSLSLPANLGEYLDSQTSTLNPRNTGHGFFVYGSWPITIVHVIAHALNQTDYSHVYLVGRRLMAVFNLLCIVLVFAIGARLYDRRVGLLAAALASVTAFTIQQSHFFTVDMAVNFFVLLFFLAAVGMVRHGGWEDIVFAGLALGMALASKISIWPLVPIAVIALVLAERRRHRGLRRDWPRLLLEVVLLGVVCFLTLRVAQPDMWAGPGWPAVAADPVRLTEATSRAPAWWFRLDGLVPTALKPLLLPEPRWAQNAEQVRGLMSGHGQDFPPNHQWWGRLDWWFPWKNMVLWGMGLALGLTVWAAWLAAGVELARGRQRHLLPWLTVAVLFFYLGMQWSKTMRYFLPIYPILLLLGAWGLVALWDWSRAGPHSDAPRRALDRLRSPVLVIALIVAVLVGSAVWAFMFSRIYARDHSRVAASRWIYHNLPSAVALTVNDGLGPGPYMPANHSASFTFSGNEYRVDAEGRLENQRVLVPGDQPVVVDGVLWSHLRDPAADAEPETIRAWLTTKPFAGPDGQLEGLLAEGSTTVDLSGSEGQAVRVSFPETTLEPGGEYYVWLGVEGAPVAGRLTRFVSETPWDDVLPLGLDGYAAYDNQETAWGEGFYAEYLVDGHMSDMYDEDEPAKVDRIVAALEESDYMLLSSNRVYGAIAQLPTRYPMSNRFYELLFGEQAGYRHLADIHSYPNLGPWELNDQSADEAWHVYDHPKVDIFEKTEQFDGEALRAELLPYTDPSVRTWRGFSVEAEEDSGPIGRFLSRATALVRREEPAAQPGPRPLEDVMLSPERRAAQARAGTWSQLFRPDSLVNRSPAASVVVWYAVLLLLGVIAFPLVATALAPLADRGWAVSRTAGLLLASWIAWLIASTGRVPHTPALVWSCVVGIAAISCLVAYRRRRALRDWLRAEWRLVLVEEGVALALFALFLAIRAGNPDLWHPWYGGEKPMDFAYLNAVLRTVSFPPYDPWFAGGQMNYYYFGFVFVGALIELTGIVPWVAYNLAIPTLAALTGLGVFGIAVCWTRRMHLPRAVSVGAGLLAAVLAVVSGNLYQVQLIARRLADVAPAGFQSRIPGLSTLARAAQGWWQVLRGDAHLGIGTGNWYWDASRAITVPTDTPITEFPFFTFLYADLHAHMMALPITVLALAAALSWAVRVERRAWPAMLPQGWRFLRLGLAALAVGALWPTNTWDYPTYVLVVVGAIAADQWRERGRPGWQWLAAVLLRAIPLVLLSLVLFWPYHATYVRPYGSFERWWGSRTPLDSYLTIHGMFLFAIVTVALVRLAALVPRHRSTAVRLAAAWGVGSLVVLGALWWRSSQDAAPDGPTPSIWVPLLGAVLVTVAGTWLAWPRLAAPERLAAWLFLMGLGLTLAVEYIVLSGDIGRMNTVFKFYIQVWILWSVLAAVAVGWLVPTLRSRDWGSWWWAGMAVLLVCGLVYPITAARAKIGDRFPAMADVGGESRDLYAENWKPGLSGIAYEGYAVYDDDGFPLHLARDRDAITWMLENLPGTPTILEGYREKAYRWGSRYSIHTGLPTIVGWDWHQKQQRNAVGGSVVDERVRDVAEIYNTTDSGRARELLDKYGVEYAIVGEMERAFYSADGLSKFDQWVDEGSASVVYENPWVRVFRVTRTGDG